MRWFTALLVTAGLIAVMVVLAVPERPFDLLVLPLRVWGCNPTVALVIVLGTAIWAAMDSASLELDKYNGGVGHPVLVFLGVVVLWTICFPMYLVTRSRRLDGELKLKKKYREPPGGGGATDGQVSPQAARVKDGT
jgi:hypothetical protein